MMMNLKTHVIMNLIRNKQKLVTLTMLLKEGNQKLQKRKQTEINKRKGMLLLLVIPLFLLAMKKRYHLLQNNILMPVDM